MSIKTVQSDRDYLRQYGDKLAESVQRAQWVGSPGYKPEHDGRTLATRDHDVIRQWAEERGAVPATVGGTEHDQHAGVLRFDFPGGSQGQLQELTWDQWFDAFDSRDLVMLFQDRLSSGEQSNFFRLTSPHRAGA